MSRWGDVIEKLSREGGVEKILMSIGYWRWRKGEVEGEVGENVWVRVKGEEDILLDMGYEEGYGGGFGKVGMEADGVVCGGGDG
ncbi:YqgE/AlgH family protein [Neisseria sicca]|uniref:YqgE/AlgH family protein n=1 Tax=Neisseria sicca TaxID=490 RepID=UPI0028FC11D2|nr:YqgE/AlgH family protein [Neisseria sicca]